MLASITPLGERSRGFSWGLTAGAFALGAVAAGTVAGATLGVLGSLPPGGAWRDAVLLAAAMVALAFDSTPLSARLPSTRRQVNEDWMTRFRGWVYGIAFGAQLGLGLATVVRSAAIYLAVLGATLSGGVLAGAVLGAAFGLVRALSLLPARTAVGPASLAALHQRVATLAAPSRWLVVTAELVAAGLLIGGLA